MSVYINGIGSISPQQSWKDDGLLLQPVDYRGVVLKCIEPDYEEWLDPRQSRRMSRIIKMGITAALMALKDAHIESPDAIITGTGYGCLEDTATFLGKLVTNNESGLNPTPFIQSTHNTIGSTIAMLLQCQGYNQTYTQGCFSFEHALLDAFLQLQDDKEKKILVGGVDEITTISHEIQSRFGVFRRRLASSLRLFHPAKKGTINGEGAGFFLLSGLPSGTQGASLVGVKTFYKPDDKRIRDGVEVFIREAGLHPHDVDFVLLGKSGNKSTDARLDNLCKTIFPKSGIGLFKHLCGEYPVASAFGFWVAARMLEQRSIPEIIVHRATARPLKHVVLFNSYFGLHYSIILLRECPDTI